MFSVIERDGTRLAPFRAFVMTSAPVHDSTQRDAANTLHVDAPLAREAAWHPLYAVGAICAVFMVMLLPLAAAGFVIAPPPRDAASAFALFDRSALAGLVSLDLIYMLEVLLAAVVLLALCVALRRTSPALVTLALFFDVLATAIYFESNPAFEMLALSQRHAAEVSDSGRAAFLAAGEAMLARCTGTAYDVSYVLAGVAGLLVAIAMRRSSMFGKLTAYLGITMGILGLVPPTAGRVGYYAAFIYLLPLVPWSILVARRLWQLAGRPRQPKARLHSPTSLRAHLLAWLVLPPIAVLNGTLRDFTYGRAMPAVVSHSLSVVPLVAAIFAVAFFVARRRPLGDRRAAIATGLTWFVLTVVFETGLGLARGVPVATLVADYDFTRGHLWALVPLTTLLAPIVAHHWTHGSAIDEPVHVSRR